MNNNKKTKDNKYEICWLQICPFDIIITDNGTKLYKPDRENFTYRLCVLNEATEKCIDVKTQQEYDYIQTSLMYFIGQSAQKIEIGKRYGIQKLSNFRSIDEKEIKLINKIISRLQKGEKFPSGNDMSNEEYLKKISSESDQDENAKTQKKVKIFKRR